VETGGEHIVAAIAEGNPKNAVARFECATTSDSAATLKCVVDWLTEQYKTKPFVSIGIASFGPVDLNPSSPTYGHVTTTPKKGWQNTNIVGAFKAAFSCPVGFETDVNAAACGEVAHGTCVPSGVSVTNYAYITIGTGVGVGIVVGGNPVHGLIHPEMGHVCVRRHPDDKFAGSCLRHGDCVEGMVASGALVERFKVKREELRNIPDTDRNWVYVADQLAQLCAILALSVSPSVIVLGGGIMNRTCLFPMIRKGVQDILKGYLQSPSLTTDAIDQYIVPASFGANTGVIGALEIAIRAAK
jgi:fructokinase